MRASGILFGALLCTGAVGRASCQVELLASGITQNTELRIRLADSTMLRGWFVAWQPGAILLNAMVRSSVHHLRLVPRTVALESVSAAWVRSGTRWKRGALVGAVIGAAGMATGFAIALQTQDPSSCSAGCWAEVLGIGTATGAALGGLVGYQFVIWRPLRF